MWGRFALPSPIQKSRGTLRLPPVDTPLLFSITIICVLAGQCGAAMGVDHGGTGDKSPPEFRVGDANANPPRFCHIGTKRSVMWPSEWGRLKRE